jgi:tetratricopeptide (TPR) repeat protein
LIAPLEEYLDQAQQHTARRRLLDDAITDYSQPASDTQKFELAQLHNLAGNTAFAQYRLDDAKIHHESELQLLQAIGNRSGQAISYHQLGIVAQEQRRFAEAEASYRQALDIYLEFGDRHTAARVYHQFGMVAEEQRRFADAEANHRQALDIYVEMDQEKASIEATTLGLLLAETDRHADAAIMLLGGARLWHQLTAEWDTRDLQYLKRERRLIGEADFRQIVTAKVPGELQGTLATAIDDAEDL